ncbi:MAG: hypothetical protein ABII02_04080 [Candidatus Magasanikbacteria bacterium]
MRSPRFFTFFLISIIAVFSALVPASTHALGLSPGYVNVKDILSSNKVLQKLHISRKNPARAEIYSVTLDGPGAKYITLDSDILELPKGERSVAFPFYIEPVGAQPGSYDARIIILPTKLQGAGESVSLLVGVAAIVNFNVTEEEITALQVSNFYMKSGYVGEQGHVTWSMRNNGNTNIRILSARIELTDGSSNQGKLTYNVPLPKTLEISPFTADKYEYTLPEIVPEGRYEAHLYLESEAGDEYTEKSTLAVLPPRQIQEKVSQFPLYALAGIGILFIGIAIYFFFISKKRKK